MQQERLENEHQWTDSPTAENWYPSKQEGSLSKDEEDSRAIVGDKMRAPGADGKLASLVTGEETQTEEAAVDSSHYVPSSEGMERSATVLQETDIDLCSETDRKTDISNFQTTDHLEIKKQLEIADRIIKVSESREKLQEENNNRNCRTSSSSTGGASSDFGTSVDEEPSPLRIQRKNSLVLALEDGQLDMDDVTVRSLHIESDINVIAQLHQLNQQFDELNLKSYHKWDSASNISRTKPPLTKAHSIASTSNTGLNSEAISSSAPILSRSGSESQMPKRNKFPLDVRPSSSMGRSNSGSKLPRQRSKEKLPSSSPEETPQSGSPQKKPKVKPSLRLQVEGNTSTGKLSEGKPSSPTFVSRLKNKILSPKSSSPLRSPSRVNADPHSDQNSPHISTVDENETNVPLRKKSPGRKGEGVRLTWPFAALRSQGEVDDDDGSKENSPGEVKVVRKTGVVELDEEESLTVTNDESHETGSSDSGMEKDWNSKSNDDLVTEVSYFYLDEYSRFLSKMAPSPHKIHIMC